MVTEPTKVAAHIDLIDGNWTRAAVDAARRAGARSPVFDYGALAARLERVRATEGMPEADRRLAVLAVDFDNENQRKLADAVKLKGIEPVKVDYRHSYVSVPFDEGEARAAHAQTLSHWIAYMCGVLATRESPTVILVTGAFEVAGPLRDFAEKRNGTAVLVFFKRLLNKRWIDNGLLDGELPVRFVDLDPYSRELLGADLRELARRNAAGDAEPGLPI